MMNLVGEFPCVIDQKGRFLLPAGLKRQLPESEDLHFVINRGFEQCLNLYPAQEWKRISDEVNQLNMYVRKNREFVRYFYRGATEIFPDGSFRLLIPKPLLEYSGIKKDLVLFAYANRIEIWDKARYEGLLTDEPDNFPSLAEEVMSKKDGENDRNTLS